MRAHARRTLTALLLVLGGCAESQPDATRVQATPIATPTPVVRTVSPQVFPPLAATGGVTLVHPAQRVLRVGFHQSNHEGAQQLTVLPTAIRPVTLEARDRLTHDRTAADVVVHPAAQIRAPVSGRVKRAGTYVLYCKYSDDYVVIAPDDRPGWEVKVLHIDGVAVGPGDRVEAGRTAIAPRATKLPFASQVDEVSEEKPPSPHVHIEVVDPAIRNIPSPGSGC